MALSPRLVFLLLACTVACTGTKGREQPGTADATVTAPDSGGPAAVDVATADLPSEPAAAPVPVIAQLLPDHGPTGGLTAVTITGQNLGAATQVRFGDTPALDLLVIDEETLSVTTPPHPSGYADVTVVSSARPEAVLAEGWRYLAQVEVIQVKPAAGPAAGGTPLTVIGNGFRADTVFVIGDRLAIQPTVLDEHTAAMLAPPGQVGNVHVAAVNADGTGLKKHAYTYRMAPRLDHAEPAIGPLTGAGPLVLHGQGLLPTGAVVTLQRPGISLKCVPNLGNADATVLTVTVPAALEAGVYDVVYANGDGSALLAAAYAYFDATQPPNGLTIATVAPASHPANALAAVDIGLTGAVTQANLAVAQVTFGGKPANISWSALEPTGSGLGATVRVLPPAADAGATLPLTVDVAVNLGQGAQAQKLAAFTYTAQQPKITSIQPLVLAAGGGTPVTLTVAPLGTSTKVLGVRIGALPATQIVAQPAGPQGLQVLAIAPQGAPGKANVTVLLAGGGEVTLAGAVQFAGTTPKLAAVLPATGAQSGGLWVDLYGSGLDELVHVAFGGVPAKELTLLDAGHARLRTPAGKPGLVNIQATFKAGVKQVLVGAFAYFDPGTGNTLTWGPAIDGAVNVTVLAKGKLAAPIPGALVTLGNVPELGMMGITDARGQVTLSYTGLLGPVNVHAAKPGFTAGSVIALGVEEVTIRLTELPKPPSGNGEGEPPWQDPSTLNAEVTGTVVHFEKYTELPPGSCAGHAIVAGQCQPCSVAADCINGLKCDDLGAAGAVAPLAEGATATASASFCSAACETDANCPTSFDCRPVGALADAKLRCVPRIGQLQVRCEASSPSIFGGAQPPGPGAIADDKGHFHLVVAPGELAVVCRSGYVDAVTGEFVALALGIKRHLSLQPKQSLGNVVVTMNHALDRRVRVRMDRLPVGPDTFGGIRSLTAGLALGGEGYVRIGDVTTIAVTDVLELKRQPNASLFTGANTDVRYELYGGLASKYGGPPSATAQATQLDVTGLDRHALWAVGTAGPVEGNETLGPVHATAFAADQRVAVGDDGRILQWTGGGFTLQPSPTQRDLFAVWLAPLGNDGWAGGQDGVLLRRKPLGWTLWSSKVSARVVAIAGRSPTDVWLADEFAQLHHWNGTVWADVAGPWPAAEATPPPSPTAGKPAARLLRALWQSPAGVLYLVGDEGEFLRGDADGAGGLTFTVLPSNTANSLHAVAGSADDDVWVAGDRGFLGHWNGNAIKQLTTGTDRPLYAIRGIGAGFPLHAVGAQGTWLRVESPDLVTDHSLPVSVDFRGILPTFAGGMVAAGEPVLVMGPYLELPYFVKPMNGQALGLTVQWQAQPGVTPTLNMVRIADSGYNTRWEIFTRGGVTQVTLPDFMKLGEFNPLPGGQLVLRLWRVYAPGLDVDHLETKSLNSYTWTSWSYNVMSTALPVAPPPDVTGLPPLPWPPK